MYIKTQNVIIFSVALNRISTVISESSSDVRPPLVWDSQHWPVYGIASGRTSESRNSESLLYCDQLHAGSGSYTSSAGDGWI